MALADVGYSPAALPAIGSTAPEEEGYYWTLEKCKKAYLDYIGSKRDEILEQQNARRYRHAVQWTAEQVEIFNKRKQPVVTYNRIGRKIDAIVGLVEKLKQDPKAFPLGPSSEQGAELATIAVREVMGQDLRKALFPFIAEAAAIDGYAGIEIVLTQGDRGDPDITFARVQNDGFFYDPRSFEPDFSDARYMGQGKWVDIDTAVELFPEQEDELKASLQAGSELSTNPDREKRWFEVDPTTRRIRLVDLWYKHKGGWCWVQFTGTNKLREGKSYLFDEKGKPICKYIMFSSFVDQDGDRYGFVRNLKSSQDEINQRRSKGLHELNSRRIKAEVGAFEDVEVARKEAVRPDGVVIYNKGFEMEFDDAARIANVEGQLKFLEDAKNEIENFGPNPALIGQGLEYKSGRAINLLQQAGLAELGPFIIGYKNWKLRLYRAIWSAVQRYWTAERWIRVSDDEGTAQFIKLNGVGIDPRTNLPVLVNRLGNLDVNIALDEGPDEVNMMADAYDTLTALAGQGANIPPQILLELSPLQPSVKRKLLGILSQPDPQTDQLKQITLAGEQAKVVKTQSEAQLNAAKAAEVAQGGAHGIVERQMDAAMSTQEFQQRQAENANKMLADREQNAMKMSSEAMKTRAGMMQTLLKMRQSEEQHRQKLRQQAASPPGGAQ